jgi:hypothetical protein
MMLKRDAEARDLACSRGAVGGGDAEGGWLGHDG